VKWPVLLHEWKEARGAAFQLLPGSGENRGIGRPELRPGCRLHESDRPKSIAPEYVFDKHTDWPGKIIEGIVECHNSAGGEEWEKPIEVRLRALVRVVSVNPQKTNLPLPPRTHIR